MHTHMHTFPYTYIHTQKHMNLAIQKDTYIDTYIHITTDTHIDTLCKNASHASPHPLICMCNTNSNRYMHIKHIYKQKHTSNIYIYTYIHAKHYIT